VSELASEVELYRMSYIGFQERGHHGCQVLSVERLWVRLVLELEQATGYRELYYKAENFMNITGKWPKGLHESHW